MKVALFQTKVAWENPEINRTNIEENFLNEKEPIELLARGRFVMRDGDIINEFHIIALEVKRDVVETTER